METVESASGLFRVVRLAVELCPSEYWWAEQIVFLSCCCLCFNVGELPSIFWMSHSSCSNVALGWYWTLTNHQFLVVFCFPLKKLQDDTVIPVACEAESSSSSYGYSSTWPVNQTTFFVQIYMHRREIKLLTKVLTVQDNIQAILLLLTFSIHVRVAKFTVQMLS